MMALARRISKVARCPINYSRSAELFQAPFIGLIICWCFFPPPPGYAVAVLAAAGAVMAVRAEYFTVTEKVLWIVIAAAFVIFEIRAISRDRSEHDNEQAEIRDNDAIIRAAERRQFERLLAQGKGLFSQEQELSKRTIDEITGGNSFAYLLTFQEGNHQSPIVIPVGRNTMYQVKVRLADPSKRLDTSSPGAFVSSATVATLEVGELAPMFAWADTNSVIPFSNGESQDFNVFFVARNGAWTEELHLRKRPGGWVKALRVYQGTKRLLMCIDKDYPRDFRDLSVWRGTPDASCSGH